MLKECLQPGRRHHNNQTSAALTPADNQTVGDLFRSQWLQVACGAKVRRWKRAARSCVLRPNALPLYGWAAGRRLRGRFWGRGQAPGRWSGCRHLGFRGPGSRAAIVRRRRSQAPSPRCSEPRREGGAGARGATAQGAGSERERRRGERGSERERGRRPRPERRPRRAAARAVAGLRAAAEGGSRPERETPAARPNPSRAGIFLLKRGVSTVRRLSKTLANHPTPVLEEADRQTLWKALGTGWCETQ